jgi:hypothetical protein
MSRLSPQSQAVMIAYWKANENSQQLGVAAALRAAADQVSKQVCRTELCTIADELENRQ